MVTRVLIVDAQPVVRQGIRGLFRDDVDFAIVGESGDAHEAYRAADSLRPELAIVDLMLPAEDGVSATAELRRRSPNTRVLLMSAALSPNLVVQGFAAGATGFVSKTQSPDELREAIRTVAAGERYLPPELDMAAVAELTARRRRGDSTEPMDLLSLRERDVFHLHTRGLSAKEIARSLFISEKTVQTHRANIFRKLRVHSGIELVRFAAVHNLLQER